MIVSKSVGATKLLHSVHTMLLNRIDELNLRMKRCADDNDESGWETNFTRRMEAEYIIAACCDPKRFAPRKQRQSR